LGSLGPYIIFEAWPIYNMSRDEYFIQKLEENILRYEYFSNKKQGKLILYVPKKKKK
jgi:hypothetical protein